MLSFEIGHSLPGLTDICYTKDGSHFVTCGQDGDILIHESENGGIEHIRCADQCSSIVVHESTIFVGTNRNELEVRSYPSGDCLPSLLHLTQPVSTLCLANSFLFVGTRDFQLLMIDLIDNSNSMKSFLGHEGPILSSSVHWEKRWISTSSCDGFIRVFHIDQQKLLKQFNLIPKSNDIDRSPSLAKLDWDRFDHILSIPVKNSIEFYESNQWTKRNSYENESIDQMIHLIRYSPCGNVFLISYEKGSISLVNRLQLTICHHFPTKETICSLSWNPRETNRVTLTTTNGGFAHLDLREYFSDSKSKPFESLQKGNRVRKMQIESEEEEEEEDGDGDEESLSNESEEKWSKKDLMKNVSSKDVEKKSFEYQEAFQSTSTSKYLESRFLLWNSVGAITCYSEQIQISFHDVSFHHSITIDNKMTKYSLADLSLSSILLGSMERNEFLCLLYQSWDSNMKQWNFQLPSNEKIQLVKLTEEFVVVGTSQKLLRLFTLSGIQQRIIRLQAPLVSLASYRNQLWIIHHSTLNLPREQALSYVFIDFDEDFYLTNPLSLTSKSKLIWTGFSESGQCFYLEKSGHLTMLRRTANNQFEPLLITNLKDEAEKNHLSNYWLLGINDFDGQFQLRVIELRSQSYPDLVPWPLVSTICPSLSLLQIDSEKSQLESDLLKLKLFSRRNDDEQYFNDQRQCLIKIFAFSCKSNREYRAFEICQLMDSITLQLAIKYATKSGKLSLAQKITDHFFEQKSNSNQSNEISSSPPSTSKSMKTSSPQQTFQPIKQTKLIESTTTTTTNPSSFSNPFKRKINPPPNETTTTTTSKDEFSQWKPTVNKSRLSSSTNKSTTTTTNVEINVENEDLTTIGKRKIDEDQFDEEQSKTKIKRNKLRQFVCQK